MIRILAPLSKNPNAPESTGLNAISKAASSGQLEIIKILAPLVTNPNAPDPSGTTPIYHAALFEHTEVIRYLVPLTKNPNTMFTSTVPTPIQIAQSLGNNEIVQLLQSTNMQ